MEKRALIFLVLSLIIVLVYPYLLEKLGLGGRPQVEKSKPVLTGPAQKKPDRVVAPPPLLPPAEERLITVETELYRAVFSTKGAGLTDWELKAYMDGGKQPPQPIMLYRAGPQDIPPLSLFTGNPERDSRLRETVFQVQGGDLKLEAGRPEGTLTFILEHPDPDLSVTKRLTFQHDRYEVEIEVEARGIEGPYQVHLGTNFGVTDWGGTGFVGFIGPMTLIGDVLHKDAPGKMGDLARHEGAPAWAALQDKYFIAALLPSQASAAVVTKQHDQAVSVGIEFPSAGQAAPPQRLKLYAGPKEYDRLFEQGVGLERSIDFGWFIFGSWSLVGVIAKPLFKILRFFYHYTHNYGIAIILLTIGVRALFIPLMHKSYKAMKAMQTLQPQMAALQKKYKDDREKLNRELMELYKKHGTNPLSGCLPILLQMPVFIALFNVLYMTIELRQAPFILWITDLSGKDPYYILPILMGGTMVIQQKMQPTTMDPRQAKLFLFMPVLFTFLFLNFPSGLVLYWLTNNVLTIAQQYITLKYMEKPS
jgi:YidC/Oxa1 family membrane protein insertase